MAKNDLMGWLDREVSRRGRQKEVAALLNEMMVQEQLAELRRKRRISQARLASLMGVKQPLIARMEAGRVKNLTMATIARTAMALGARVELRLKPLFRNKRASALSPKKRSRSSA